MAELEPNPASNDLSHFKEEILKLVRESENKLTAQIANKESALNTDYENFVSKIKKNKKNKKKKNDKKKKKSKKKKDENQ